MKAGDLVAFVRRGKAVPAHVVGHTDSGASGYKVLTLAVGDEIYESVPHEADAKKKGGYWREHATPGPEPEAKTIPAPVEPSAKAEGRASAGVGDSSED